MIQTTGVVTARPTPSRAAPTSVTATLRQQLLTLPYGQGLTSVT